MIHFNMGLKIAFPINCDLKKDFTIKKCWHGNCSSGWSFESDTVTQLYRIVFTAQEALLNNLLILICDLFFFKIIL